MKSDDDAVSLINHALKLGITLLDTADVYGNLERQVCKALAEERDCTPAQLALAWLLNGNDNVVPIPGTSSRARLQASVTILQRSA